MRTAVALVNFSGNQKPVCAKSSGWVVQLVDEIADQLALGCGWITGVDQVDEVADQLALGCDWITGVDQVDEVADQLALGSMRITGDRVDEIADEMTEILHVKTLSNLRVRTLRAVIA
jgi:hypothetical protein